MRKIFFLLFLLFSLLYADRKLEFSVGFMMNIGEDQEKVFDNGKLLSLLQWPILPNLGMRFSAGLSFRYFHIAFNSSFGIPMFTGNMKDSDYTDPQSSEKTLFSSHKTMMNKNILIYQLIGVPFIIPSKKQKIILEPQIGFYFSLKSWYAKNGYIQYKSEDGSKFWTKEWPKKDYTGNGVEYNQKIFFPFIAFNTIINDKISFNISFSPLLQGTTEDTHFDTKKIYVDIFSFPSYAFEIKSLFEKEISKRVNLYADISFYYFYSRNGRTTIIEYDNKEIIATYPKGSSGMEGKELKLVVGTTFKFF